MAAKHPLSPTTDSIRVVIVNTFPLFAVSLTTTLQRIVREVEIIIANDIEAAAPHLRGYHADLAILDIDGPGTFGMSYLGKLRALMPAARVVTLSGTHEPSVMSASRALGAAGYISKSAPVEAVLNTLRKILAGSTTFERDNVVSLGYGASRRPQPAKKMLQVQVTPKQVEVLKLLCRGLPNKTIGRLLEIQPSTVKAHVSALLRAYDARSRAELVSRAYATGTTA